MNDEPKPKTSADGKQPTGVVASFFLSLARDLFKYVIAFAVGTGAGAIVCWYYGLPMFLSLLGGILVLALALAITTDSLFS